MPEEINRLLTDHLADLLFTPSEDGDENLRREGIPATKIFFVGNVMIDSLVRLLPSAKKTSTDSVPERYALVTLHRPANVDNSVTLKGILESPLEVNRDLAVVFPAHPRTRKRISDFGLNAGQLLLLDPLPYVVVITDSGGIQEETTYLGIPCLTVRENTERPITVSMGTNVLVGRDRDKLRSSRALVGDPKKENCAAPLGWTRRGANRRGSG
jgi:UDP-N-acetylglucosamine 2-epimerase (non-hydrolysing)